MVRVDDVSVINQMLRDLDQRQVRQPAAQPTAPMMNAETNSSSMRIVALVIFVAAIAIAYYFFAHYQSDTPVTSAAITESSQQPAATPEPVAETTTMASASESDTNTLSAAEPTAVAVDDFQEPLDRTALEQGHRLGSAAVYAAGDSGLRRRAESAAWVRSD